MSWQYPIVELITGALFVLVVWQTPLGPLLVSRLLLVCILIALFGIDLEHQILPNSITLPGIVIGLLLSLIAPPGWRDALLGTLLGAGILYAIAGAYYLWRREEGHGHGRRQDARHDRRVPRLEGGARDARAGVVLRRDHRRDR